MRKQRLLKPAKHFQRWIDGEHWIECTGYLRYISHQKFRPIQQILRTEVLAKTG